MPKSDIDVLVLKLSSLSDALKLVLDFQVDLKNRISRLEVGLASVRKELAVSAEHVATIEYHLSKNQDPPGARTDLW